MDKSDLIKSGLIKSENIDETDDENIYVSFYIGGEIYGINVKKVHEIIGMIETVHIPHTLPFMKGVINLRGIVVPLIDMRIKFNLESKEYDRRTVIIIVEVNKRLFGMIVDSVSDVVNIPIRDIQDTPHFSSIIDRDFVIGIGQIHEKLIIIIDVDKILTLEEIKKIDEK